MKNAGRNSVRVALAATLALSGLAVLAACSHTYAPVVQYAQLQGADSNGIHTVERGDTVGSIAARYRLDIRDILVVNALQPPYRLVPGQRLRLPAPRTYRVRDGDSLYSVARLFSSGVNQIVRMNNLRAPYALAAGQVLKLPVVTNAPARADEEFSVPRVRGEDMPRVARAAEGNVERGPLSSAPAARAPASVVTRIPDDTPPRSGNGKFMMPVSGAVLSSYGPKPGGLHNDGINIKAPMGAPVRAAENGMVVYVGDELKGYGRLILIRHADHWMTAYAHLHSTLVKKGMRVRRGQAIGTVGETGNVGQPQLHFEIRHGTEALNPEKFV